MDSPVFVPKLAKSMWHACLGLAGVAFSTLTLVSSAWLPVALCAHGATTCSSFAHQVPQRPSSRRVRVHGAMRSAVALRSARDLLACYLCWRHGARAAWLVSFVLTVGIEARSAMPWNALACLLMPMSLTTAHARLVHLHLIPLVHVLAKHGVVVRTSAWTAGLFCVLVLPFAVLAAHDSLLL